MISPHAPREESRMDLTDDQWAIMGRCTSDASASCSSFVRWALDTVSCLPHRISWMLSEHPKAPRSRLICLSAAALDAQRDDPHKDTMVA